MTTKNGKTMNKALMMGTALVTLGALSTQANAATGTGSMSAVVLTPIVVAAPTDLNFGSITDNGGGTVVMAPVAGRSATGPTLVTGAGAETPGILSITGATGVNIDLAMGAGPFDVSNGAAVTMAVNAFNLVTDAAGSATVITLTASPQSFPIGATLNVAASQAPGTYTGTYQVTASYQ